MHNPASRRINIRKYYKATLIVEYMFHVSVIWIIFCKQSWDASDSTLLTGQLERKN